MLRMVTVVTTLTLYGANPILLEQTAGTLWTTDPAIECIGLSGE